MGERYRQREMKGLLKKQGHEPREMGMGKVYIPSRVLWVEAGVEAVGKC